MSSSQTLQLPGYDIKQPLGEGGMATVYLGYQRSLNREVAIKVLDATLVSDPLVQHQFQQESLLIAQLNHPNIIHVIDQGTINENEGALLRPYFVMQYVKSISLAAITRREDVSLTRKMDIVIQICKALSYAHRNDVVHRDIKPANVLVDYDGHVRVVDFGIAGYFKRPVSSESTSSESTSNKSASKENDQTVIMGTPAYMAPEQADPHQQASHLSDIYSLGVLMHELFLGRRPSEANGNVPAVPRALMDIVRQCLHGDASLRPQSADEVSRSLLTLLQGRHLHKPQWEKERQRDQLPGDYKLLDVFKENQFGASYLVSDPGRQRWLVIKKQQLAFEGSAYTTATALSGVSHPHIATIHGTARNERVFIVVMEYVTGGSLQDRLTQAFSLERWLMLAQQICEALMFAHDLGVVHGNLRPSNILVESASSIKLTDFGFDDHSVGDGIDWYQPLSEPKSVASDIFSMGAVLFHLLTGQVIQQGHNGVSNLSVLNRLPKPLAKIIRRMLAKEPAKRYASVYEVKVVLEQFLAAANPSPALVVKNTLDTAQVPAPRSSRLAKLGLGLILIFFIVELVWLFRLYG